MREAVCHSAETCTPDRMIGIALSQGGIQDALRTEPSVKTDVDEFCDVVRERCPDKFDIVFSYRMRLVIK